MKKMRMILALLLAALTLLSFAMAEQTDRAAAYEEAMALYKAKDYEQAQQAFEALDDYKDSRSLANKSKWYLKEQRYRSAVSLYKEGSYEEAKALFEELGSFEESRDYVRKCDAALQRQQYNQAKDLYKAEDYEAAKVIFEALGRYESSRDYLEEINEILAAQQLAAYEQECYEKALALKAEGRLEEARDLFIQAGNCEGATDELYLVLEELAKETTYQRAAQDMSRGAYHDAMVRYETLGDYQDSAEHAADAREAYLKSLYDEAGAAQDPARAYAIYLSLADYQDSAQKAAALSVEPAAVYAAAEALEDENRPAQAAAGYAAISHKDSAERAEAMAQDAEKFVLFERAHILTELWQLEEANAIYESLGDYSYASRMGMERITAVQLRDDATTPVSETFTAPDGTTHRYQMFKGVPRWVEAKAFCEALGGHLATMTTPEENEFVHDFMWDSGFTTAYFGLEDEERDRTWEWVTGEPVEYLNWDSGEPSYSPRERYGMYFYKHIQGTWNDAHFYEDDKWGEPGCSYICEWDD